MDEFEEDLKESNKQFKEIAKTISNFTNLLNKYNLDYQIAYWGDGEGASICLDEIEILFYIGGAIEFKPKEKTDFKEP